MTDTCQAYQASDQMICPCGRQWDVNDPEPPKCYGQPISMARFRYMAFIKRVFKVEGGKK